MKRALVVDDNEINRLLVCRLLSKAGWTVAEAEDGDKALVWLAANQVDLILLDISMPTLSGEDVCKQTRAHRFGGDEVRIVAYTAHAMAEDCERFLTTGFDKVLTKPVSRQSLAAVLAELGFLE